MAKKVDAEVAARAAAAYFGSMGGRKSRANMTAAQRSEAARKAGIARALAAGQTIRKHQDFEVRGPTIHLYHAEGEPGPALAPPKSKSVDVSRGAVLSALGRFKSQAVEIGILATDMGVAIGDRDTYRRLGNTLSSLRTAGKVKSEPMPGSAREKLWRIVK